MTHRRNEVHSDCPLAATLKRNDSMTKQIAVMSTGGTIEKTYDELQGVLHNKVSILDVMLASLELRGIEIVRTQLMNKDSLDMNPSDHKKIASTVASIMTTYDGVVIVHGTDRLTVTGDHLCQVIPKPSIPIVLTGAMRPYELRRTDALQNLTESLLAVQILSPGVYVVMHNQILPFPGIIKDRQRGTFSRSPDASP